MSAHLIRKLPEYWVNEETNILFNGLGFSGWELVRIYNQYAYFINCTYPIKYKFVKTDNYWSNFENTLSVLGQDDWIFILNVNGYSVFKQIQIES